MYHAAERVHVVDTTQDLAEGIAELGRAPILAFDTETTGLDPHTDHLRLLTLASPACTVIVDTRCTDWEGLVRPLFADSTRVVVAHNAAFDLRFLLVHGIEVDAVVHDTLIMAQLLDGGSAYEDSSADKAPTGRRSYALAAVVERALGERLAKEQQRSDWDADCLSDEQLAYAARDAEILLPLYAHQRTAIEAAGLAQIATIEAACTPALAWLAHAGMPFDRPAWEALAGAAAVEMKDLRRAIAKALVGTGANAFGGFHFSPDSPAQVATLLAHLGIQTPRGTQGAARADEAVLMA